MDGAFHYRQSERLLGMIENLTGGESRDEIAALLWLSRIHAELATAAALIEQADPGQRWRDALAAAAPPVPSGTHAPEPEPAPKVRRPHRRTRPEK